MGYYTYTDIPLPEPLYTALLQGSTTHPHRAMRDPLPLSTPFFHVPPLHPLYTPGTGPLPPV